MKKDYTLFIIGLMVCFGFGFLVASIYYLEKGETSWGRAYTVSEMIGTGIMNPQGEEFGRVNDFVIDTNGRVRFTVLSYGEKLVVIPFETLTYSIEGKHLVLDLAREKLDSAPAFDQSVLADRKWAEDTYKRFGQAPYWTEAGSEQIQDLPKEAPGSEYPSP
jgi:sporulation protein YlmC with PRC-barrel domain